MFFITLIDCLTLTVIIAMAYWLPFIVMLPLGARKLSSYRIVSANTWLLPPYWLMEVLQFIVYTLFVVAACSTAMWSPDPMSTDPLLVSWLLIAFVRVSLAHVTRTMMYGYSCAYRSAISQFVVWLLDIAMVVLSGVIWNWLAMCTMIVALIIDTYFFAAFVNWIFTVDRIKKKLKEAMKKLTSQASN